MTKAFLPLITPVVHRHDSVNFYRVFMHYIDKEPEPVYEFHLGNNRLARYVARTLPPEMKESVAIINSIPFEYSLDARWQGVYSNVHSPSLDRVGWRVVPSTQTLNYGLMYIIVMTKDYLQGMKDGKNP